MRHPMQKWLGVPRSKTAFAKAARYDKLFLSYRPFIGALDDLVTLGYVKQKKGFKDRTTGIGYQTRIRGRVKLQQLFARYRIEPTAITAVERELIILRDGHGRNIDYEDTPQIEEWRNQLRAINQRLSRVRIRLHLPDNELQTLKERMWREQEATLDYGHYQLHRVFNNGRFDQGGRFYGGWWQNVPRESRKYLEINYKATVEVDYTGLQLRMLYAMLGLQAPEDPYNAPNWGRDTQKKGILILLNAETRESALRALASNGISDANRLIAALEAHHAPIARYFHSGIGVGLQFLDSQLAATIMSRALINVLPVHDSFIVRIGSESELVELMESAFVEQFPGQRPSMAFKQTVLSDAHERARSQSDFVSTRLDPSRALNYTEYHS